MKRNNLLTSWLLLRSLNNFGNNENVWLKELNTLIEKTYGQGCNFSICAMANISKYDEILKRSVFNAYRLILKRTQRRDTNGSFKGRILNEVIKIEENNHSVEETCAFKLDDGQVIQINKLASQRAKMKIALKIRDYNDRYQTSYSQADYDYFKCRKKVDDRGYRG